MHLKNRTSRRVEIPHRIQWNKKQKKNYQSQIFSLKWIDKIDKPLTQINEKEKNANCQRL